LRGIARLKAERLERDQHQRQKQERETSSLREHESERQASIWDALDGIGRETHSPDAQATASEAMQRIQERTTGQRQEREREGEEIERAKLDREKMEQERGVGLGFGF